MKWLASLDQTIWIASLLVELSILGVILYRRPLVQLYSFHAYLVFDIGKSLFLWNIYHYHAGQYALWYWKLRAVFYILQAALAAQITCLALRRPVTRVIYVFAESVAIAELLIIFTAPVLVTEPLLYLDLAAALVCCLLLLLALCIHKLEWPCEHIAWGMICLSAFQIVISIVRLRWGWNHFEVLRRIYPGTALVVLTMWLIVLTFGKSEHRHRNLRVRVSTPMDN